MADAESWSMTEIGGFIIVILLLLIIIAVFIYWKSASDHTITNITNAVGWG